MRRIALLSLALSTASVGTIHAGTRAADELFWVPTLEQALDMAAHTGRPIFFMHYTCVGEKTPTFSGKSTVF